VGQAIVYCAGCQVRVRDVDVDEGKAFQVQGQTWCRTCAAARFPGLPERPVPAGGGPVPKLASTRRIPVSVPRASAGPWIAAGGAAAVLVVALLALNRPPRPAPAAAPAPPPVVVRPAPANPAPAPPAPAKPVPAPPAPMPVADRDAGLRIALADAKEHGRANPSDFAGTAERLEKVRFRAEGSPMLAETLAELDALHARFRAAVAPELKELDAETARLAAAGDFRAARAVLEKARSRHALTDWTALLNAKAAELEASAAPAFAALREQALKARRAGEDEEVKRLLDQVRRWGFRRYWEDLDRALSDAAPK
jgi:hypothetical protein